MKEEEIVADRGDAREEMMQVAEVRFAFTKAAMETP